MLRSDTAIFRHLWCAIAHTCTCIIPIRKFGIDSVCVCVVWGLYMRKGGKIDRKNKRNQNNGNGNEK